MKAVFRVDASTEIGIGHVIRCLTLADKLQQRDFQNTFVCKELPGNMIEEIQKEKVDVRGEEALLEPGWDWLVVDHYDLDCSFETSMRSTVTKILVIDDLANRVHDCDLLLDQNLYDDMESRYTDLMPESSRVLTGPRFALLRPEFIDARRRVKRDNQLRRILIFFGGSDPTNETIKVLHAIRELNLTDISVDVLVGLSNPHRNEIKEYVRDVPGVSILKHTDRISELILRADLAIGSGGATSWERCCLGLPSITIAVAANQIMISRGLADRGYQTYLGTSQFVTVEDIVAAVRASMDRFPDTVATGLKSMELVDGMGADRVVDAMGRA